jgi:putative flippase GtrA
MFFHSADAREKRLDHQIPDERRLPCGSVSKAAGWITGAFCLYFLLVTTAILFFSSFNAGAFYGVKQRWPREGPPVWLSHFATWDAAHYLYLSEVGYNQGVSSCAFYPLWPLLVLGVATGIGVNHVWAGLVLANLLAVAGFSLFWWVVRERLGARTAWWACVFLFLFPGSLFFHFVYSEPLFFLLVMLMVAGLERNRYGLVWAAAFLLPLTRAIGLFGIVPLAWHLIARQWDGVRGGNIWSGARGASSPRPSPPSDGGEGGWVGKVGWRERLRVFSSVDFVRRALVMLGAPILGLGLYFGLMWHWTGNPFQWQWLHTKAEKMKRFLQFCMVGASGVFVDMGVLFLISDPAVLGWPAPLGKALAVEIAILNNFCWNELWTFGDLTLGQRGYLQRLNRLGRFNAICLAGLVIGVSVVWVLHVRMGWNLYLANLSAIGIVTGWNFGMNYKFSWGTSGLKQPLRVPANEP